MSHARRTLMVVGVAALGGALAGPTPPSVAATPAATTQPASLVTGATARLNGRVDPNREVTTYNFQFGRTRRLGSSTPLAPAGSGDAAVRVQADLADLRSNTVYYFRLVASNASGVRSGQTRTFRTKRIPLALSIAPARNPVGIGEPVTITGRLTGSDNAARPIQLQRNAWPFTDGFANVGNPVLTGPQGGFRIPVLRIGVQTQFRAVVSDAPARASAAIVVGARPTVSTAVTTTRPRRGQTIRFAGTVRPRFNNAEVAIQRRAGDGRWLTVAGTLTQTFRDDRSRYAKRVRVSRSGTYRVFVGQAGSRYAPATGRVITLRVR